MSISEEQITAEIFLLQLSGRLDHTQSDELQRILRTLIERGFIELIVDLSTVSYINSSGLRCLVSGWRQAGNLGGQLVLCGLDSRLDHVFTTVGFDKVFDIFSTRTEAINHLTAS